MSVDPHDQILHGSQHAEKSFSFTERDPSMPTQWWFQQETQGTILFVVFYTQACRWNRCLGCNLPATCSLNPVHYREIMAQIDHIFALDEVKARAHEIHKIIVSNNGSVLDQLTFPTTALFYLLARINTELPYLDVLSLESRAEYVEWDELSYIARALEERDRRAELELAIGFEAFDDHIRNDVFNKGLSLKMFEQLVDLMSPYRYRLKSYFMLKPVMGMSDDEAVADIHHAIDYLHEQATRSGVPMNMHLNPTYAAYGTQLAEAFASGQFVPPTLADVARAARHARGKALTIYLGLFDEGLAVPGGSFLRDGDEPLRERLEEFNRTQDFDLLELDDE
jgi:archaeosine synthase beta-subunit